MKGVKPLILAGIVAASAAVHANDLNTVIDKSSDINNLAAQSQTKIDKIADSMQGRLQQFKTLMIMSLYIQRLKKWPWLNLNHTGYTDR